MSGKFCGKYFMSHLGTFKEEGIPDVEVSADWQGVHEQAEEPVEGEKGGVNAVGICEGREELEGC
jgi:hypothetical protein